VRPWSSWDEEWPVDLDFVKKLAAAFLEAGFRHIAVQNTRNPVQRMNDVAAATSHTAALVGQLVDHPKVLGFRPI